MKSTASSHMSNSVACNVSMMYIVFFLKRCVCVCVCVKRHIFACKKKIDERQCYRFEYSRKADLMTCSPFEMNLS